MRKGIYLRLCMLMPLLLILSGRAGNHEISVSSEMQSGDTVDEERMKAVPASTADDTPTLETLNYEYEIGDFGYWNAGPDLAIFYDDIYEQTIVEVIPLGYAETGDETMAEEAGTVHLELVNEEASCDTMSKVSQARLKEQEASTWTRKVYHILHGNASTILFSSPNTEKRDCMAR